MFSLASLARLPVPLAVAIVVVGSLVERAAEGAVRAWRWAGERRMPRDET
jgi:CTP synthase (UTP-ammonia lyase)